MVGASALEIDAAYDRLTAGEHVIHETDWITVDGSTGRIILGQVPTREPELTDDFRQLMAWADEFRTLRVRANADTPADAATGREVGARRASASAAPSTCSSRAIASTRCAR